MGGGIGFRNHRVQASLPVVFSSNELRKALYAPDLLASLEEKTMQKKLWTMSVLVMLAFAGVCLVKPAFADIPRIINVVPWNSGGNTMLNVTVYHDSFGAEEGGHYVDRIEVDVGSTIQNFTQAGPHAYYDAVNHYFNVTVGPITGVTGTPTATVKAHCTIHLWSTQNWTGQIPEYTTLALLLILLLASPVVIFVRRRNSRIFTNQ